MVKLKETRQFLSHSDDIDEERKLKKNLFITQHCSSSMNVWYKVAESVSILVEIQSKFSGSSLIFSFILTLSRIFRNTHPFGRGGLWMDTVSPGCLFLCSLSLFVYERTHRTSRAETDSDSSKHFPRSTIRINIKKKCLIKFFSFDFSFKIDALLNGIYSLDSSWSDTRHLHDPQYHRYHSSLLEIRRINR